MKEVLVDFDRWSLVRAKNLKGHRERLMLVSKEAPETTGWGVDWGSVSSPQQHWAEGFRIYRQMGYSNLILRPYLIIGIGSHPT